MLRITIKLFPYGETEGKRQLAQIDVANISNNADGTANYLYSVLEPEPLSGQPIDVKGILKVQQQGHAIMFLRELLNTLDSGRTPTPAQENFIDEMREIR